jgi:hypothetical protein
LKLTYNIRSVAVQSHPHHLSLHLGGILEFVAAPELEAAGGRHVVDNLRFLSQGICVLVPTVKERLHSPQKLRGIKDQVIAKLLLLLLVTETESVLFNRRRSV